MSMTRPSNGVRGLAVWVTLLAVSLPGCAGGPRFSREDLPRIVLQEEDAPAGTQYVDSDSGYRTVDDLAETLDEKRSYENAGFRGLFVAFFLSPELFPKGIQGPLSPKGSSATSMAMAFEDPEGAEEALRILERDVRADGRNLFDRPAEGLGEESFALYGTLEPSLPPGYLYAWRVDNAVLVLIASGAPGAISEAGARDLAGRMAERAR